MTARPVSPTGLCLLAASGAAFAALPACAPRPSCTGEWCGTAVVAVAGEAGTLFPPSANTNIELALVDLLFLKLADPGEDLNTVGDAGFVPRLAQSWQFDDALTLRFTLDSAARWHDGTPVTAEDVAFTFAVYRDPLVNAMPRPRLSRITSVAARDSRSVVFRFTESYAEQFFDAVHHMRILPRHLLDTVPRDRLVAHPFGRHPVGNGPYRFVRWKTAEFMELAADSAFFLGRPGLPRVIWRFTTDPGAAVSQLLAGEADIIEFLGAPENVRRVAAARHLEVLEYPSLFYSYIAFNLRDPAQPERPHPLFGDRAVRRALAMAVDRAAVVRAVLGEYGELAVGPVTRVMSVWSDSIFQLPFDSARARRELAELGWRDADGDGVRERGGRRLEFELLVPATSRPRVRAAQIVQDQLRRLGITLRIVELDFETTLARASAGRFDAWFGAFGGDPSPSTIAEVWISDAIGSFNYGRYANPRVDRLVQQARLTTDPSAARRLWREAIGELNADAAAIFIYEPVMTAGVHRRFDNVSIRPDQWAANLWMWRVAPGQRIDRDRYGVN